MPLPNIIKIFQIIKLWSAQEIPLEILSGETTRKNDIMDRFFLNNEESESCLSCMWNTLWSSSSSLPNMKAIQWRMKVTYNFEKKVNQKVNLGWRPALAQTLLF